MGRSLLKAGVFFLIGVIFQGCGMNYILVASANNEVRGGDFQDAVQGYSKALRVSDSYPGYIHYNLGCVYYQLGEVRGAQDEWVLALEGTGNEDSPELEYHVNFNHGVLLYKAGDYSGAYKAFKEALLLVPDDTEAKINLEYSFRQINSKQTAAEKKISTKTKNTEERKGEEQSSRILNYIKEREQDTWTSESNNTEQQNTEDW